MSDSENVHLVWLKRIRNLAGILGMILPWVALLGAVIVSKANPGSIPSAYWEDFSISATYYLTPPLAGILTTAAVVLMCYKGYTLKDHIVTTISGVFGILIVVFPCRCAIATEDMLVGFFQLPVKISHIVHCTSAVLFFILLAYNSIRLFTQTGNQNNMTDQKKIRNIVYRVCGIGMLCSMALMVIPVPFFAKTFIVEAIALTFFGISWLVKGGFLGILADK